jgi:hypothetical protein
MAATESPMENPPVRSSFSAGKMAARCAKQIAQNMEAYSMVIDPVKESSLPRFDRDEIVLDDLLGSGGFNDVYALHSIDLKVNKDEMSNYLRDGLDAVQEEGRADLACYARAGSYYAIKFLKKETMANEEYVRYADVCYAQVRSYACRLFHCAHTKQIIIVSQILL